MIDNKSMKDITCNACEAYQNEGVAPSCPDHKPGTNFLRDMITLNTEEMFSGKFYPQFPSIITTSKGKHGITE